MAGAGALQFTGSVTATAAGGNTTLAGQLVFLGDAALAGVGMAAAAAGALVFTGTASMMGTGGAAAAASQANVTGTAQATVGGGSVAAVGAVAPAATAVAPQRSTGSGASKMLRVTVRAVSKLPRARRRQRAYEFLELEDLRKPRAISGAASASGGSAGGSVRGTVLVVVKGGAQVGTAAPSAGAEGEVIDQDLEDMALVWALAA